MTTQAQFTNDEWKILSDAPVQIGSAVAAASPSGLVGSAKEGMFIVNNMSNAARHYPGNRLIQTVAPQGINSTQAMGWAHIARGMLMGSEASMVRSEGVEICRRVDHILEQKANPQEASEFKRWLMEIGEGVAQASSEGGGGFMGTGAGGGASAISTEEGQTLRDMAIALKFQPQRP